ncbi:hypothetical protein G647_10159 [Cladophialophora carrionii CBS 160.54]|uniref:Glutathione S-transferase UstS-like C-terminal domain-containing protein n=1 Tax=Cladophialophora carrionii CBS 160.54 TaxID=1279043 RepID=V9DJM1_9EURO|nr:uncharacterized protein G647_10159 [Cladophialophora carrionii CBS 160.54]ETI27060.1 hypothetical protein G647_10159 [Cladophialophora carrionii CBS 160.54]
MDSKPIAMKLESLYPEPSLHLDSLYQSRIEDLLSKIQVTIQPIFMPRVPKTFLNPSSAHYFISTREKALRMSLVEYGKGEEKAYNDVKPFLKELGQINSENDEGPFVLGIEISYSDLMVLALLRMMDRLDGVERFWAMEGGDPLKKAYEAAGKWLERDTY